MGTVELVDAMTDEMQRIIYEYDPERCSSTSKNRARLEIKALVRFVQRRKPHCL